MRECLNYKLASEFLYVPLASIIYKKGMYFYEIQCYAACTPDAIRACCLAFDRTNLLLDA